MFVESNEFYLLQGSTLSFRQSQSLSEALTESEFFSLLEAGVNKAPGAGKAKIISSGKKYVERVDKMLKKIDKDPEAALNDPEFVDLVQNFDERNESMRRSRAKLLGVTDEQIKPTDIRIVNRLRKGENIFSAIEAEYSKTFDRFNTAFDDGGMSILLMIAVLIVNTMVITLLINSLGPVVGMYIGAVFCAPITEEFARRVTANRGKRSFSYAINIYEYYSYALMGLTIGGIGGMLFTIVWRTLFSTNMHQINETHLHSEKLRNIVTKQITRTSDNTSSGLTLLGNITRHAVTNAFAYVFQPLLIIWELVYGQFRNEEYIKESTFSIFTDHLLVESLFEGAIITTSGGLEIDLLA